MKIGKLINQKVDIVEYIGRYTELKPKGNLFEGRCPIHKSEEGTPLVVYPHTNSYHCFACESSGDVISFVMDYEDVPFNEAVKQLAREYNIDIQTDETFMKSMKVEEDFTKKVVACQRNVSRVSDYLHKRGFTDETIQEFGLGEESGNLIIPIHNSQLQVVAIAKRQFDRKPKYLNSINNVLYDKSALLFNIGRARRLVKHTGELYMVEGYMDAMSGHQMGLATVAYCGNEVHRDQLRSLPMSIRQMPTIIYCPDNDAEGLKRVPRVRDYFKEVLPKAVVKVLQLPEGCKDLNDALMAGINVETLPKIHIDRFALMNLLDTCKAKEEEYDSAYQFLKSIANPILKSDLIKQLAERWGRDYTELRAYFDSVQDDVETLIKNAAGVEESINDLRQIYQRGEYKTHFQRLDDCIGGLSKGQGFILGAYSSAGKTGWAIEYILRQVIANKMRCVFFSLEMQKGKVMERMIAMILKINMRDVRELILQGDERIQQVVEKLKDRLIIYDDNNLSMDDIERRIASLNQKNLLGGPVDLVVVDYFTYLKGANTYEGASGEALKMKGLAKKYNIILFMLSQLNRSAGTYNEPTMDMLRMTGDIEASGDVIVMLWRPEKEPGLSLEKQQKLQNITRLKVEKARDGMYGPSRMELKYNSETSRLEEI